MSNVKLKARFVTFGSRKRSNPEITESLIQSPHGVWTLKRVDRIQGISHRRLTAQRARRWLAEIGQDPEWTVTSTSSNTK